MKKIIGVLTALAAALGFAVIAAPVAASAATTPDEFCWVVTETVHHDAVGDATIPNPSYVPAQPEIPAVTHTEWKYVKIAGPGELWLNNDTNKYVDSNGNAAQLGDWPIYERTQKTRVVEDSPAIPAVPAVGEPTIPNPNYVEAYDEEVEVGERCAVTVNWQTTFLNDNPQNAGDVSWPQPFLAFGADYVPECGVQVQQDDYEGWRADIDAVLADDSLHDNPIEDSSIVKDWRFLDGGECAPVLPEPKVTVTETEWEGVLVSCEVPEAEWTRVVTTTTTPWINVGDPHSGWTQVLDTEHATSESVPEHQTVVYDGDDCVTEEPPTEEPPTKVSTPEKELAYPGFYEDNTQLSLTALWAAGLLAVGTTLY